MPAVFAGCASGHTSLEQRDEHGHESSKPAIHWDLTAKSDRLAHFGHRMSLFLRTLVLRGILSSEQE